ncbi:MAG TPA: choice-of-anchor D domain-containing protein, partial [Kofleriaceae bacterium]
MQMSAGRRAVLCASSTLVLGCNQLLGVGELHESKQGDAGLAIDAASDAPPGGQAVLVLDTGTYQFGTVVTGASPVEHTFTISNTGTAASGPVHAEITGTAMSSFSIGTNGCTGALDAGRSCAIAVRFAPVATGPVDASLHVTASPGGDLGTALSGTGLAPGALIVTPDSVSYGLIVVNGVSSPQTLSVKNTGGADSGAIDVQLTGSDAGQFALEPPAIGDCQGATLAMNQICKVRLHFAPTGPGSKSASVVVSSASAGTISGSLVGTGVNALTATPAVHDFNVLGTGDSSAPFAFTIGNGSATTTGPIMFALGGADAGQFTIVSPGPGDCILGTTALAMGASCTVRVRFAPTMVGAKSASLAFTASPGGNASATATGTAVTPAALAVAGT